MRILNRLIVSLPCDSSINIIPNGGKVCYFILEKINEKLFHLCLYLGNFETDNFHIFDTQYLLLNRTYIIIYIYMSLKYDIFFYFFYSNCLISI